MPAKDNTHDIFCRKIKLDIESATTDETKSEPEDVKSELDKEEKERRLEAARRASKYGKKKIDIKKILDPSMRRVCMTKRGPGLVKKAIELSILCSTELVLFCRDPLTGNVIAYTNLCDLRKFWEDVMIQYSHDADHVRKFVPESYSKGIGNLHKIKVETIMSKKKSGRPRKVPRYEEEEDDSDIGKLITGEDHGLYKKAIDTLMKQLRGEKYKTMNMEDETKIYLPRENAKPLLREPYTRHYKRVKIPKRRVRKSKLERDEDKGPPSKYEQAIDRPLDLEGSVLSALTRLKLVSQNNQQYMEEVKKKWVKTDIKQEVMNAELSNAMPPLLEGEYLQAYDQSHMPYVKQEHDMELDYTQYYQPDNQLPLLMPELEGIMDSENPLPFVDISKFITTDFTFTEEDFKWLSSLDTTAM